VPRVRAEKPPEAMNRGSGQSAIRANTEYIAFVLDQTARNVGAFSVLGPVLGRFPNRGENSGYRARCML